MAILTILGLIITLISLAILMWKFWFKAVNFCFIKPGKWVINKVSGDSKPVE